MTVTHPRRLKLHQHCCHNFQLKMLPEKTESNSLLLWKPQVPHFICNISPLDPVLSNINPFTTFISCFSHTYLNINSQFMSSLPFKFPDINVACLCHLFHACYMPCPASPQFSNTRGLYWTVQIMKFLIKQFPATPCQFLTLIQTIPLAHYSQGQVSTVHIVTCYRLDGLWFDPWWGARGIHFGKTCPDWPWCPPSLQQWVGVQLPAHGTDYPLPSGSRVKTEYRCTSTPILCPHDMSYGEFHLFTLFSNTFSLCLSVRVMN